MCLYILAIILKDTHLTRDFFLFVYVIICVIPHSAKQQYNA